MTNSKTADLKTKTVSKRSRGASSARPRPEDNNAEYHTVWCHDGRHGMRLSLWIKSLHRAVSLRQIHKTVIQKAGNAFSF